MTRFPYNTKYGPCQIHFDLPIISIVYLLYRYLFPCCSAMLLTLFVFMTKGLLGLGFDPKRRKMSNITGQQEKTMDKFCL